MRSLNIYKMCLFGIMFLSFCTLHSQSYVNVFSKVTNEQQFPQVFAELDSTIEDFYNNKYSQLNLFSNLPQYLDELSEEELLKYAKLFVKLHYLPKEHEFKYWPLARKPFREQYKRMQDLRQQNKVVTEKRAINPMAFYAKMKTKIFEKLPWEWSFHLQNKYLLHVKITSTQKGTPGRSDNMPYYTCQVIKDLKGNFKGNENIDLTAGFVTSKVDLNSEYLVLVWGRGSSGEPDPATDIINYWLVDYYLVRGHSTNKEAFFPIVNNTIIDKNKQLRFDKGEIPIPEFEASVKDFIQNTAGVNTNEN